MKKILALALAVGLSGCRLPGMQTAYEIRKERAEKTEQYLRTIKEGDCGQVGTLAEILKNPEYAYNRSVYSDCQHALAKTGCEEAFQTLVSVVEGRYDRCDPDDAAMDIARMGRGSTVLEALAQKLKSSSDIQAKDYILERMKTLALWGAKTDDAELRAYISDQFSQRITGAPVCDTKSIPYARALRRIDKQAAVQLGGYFYRESEEHPVMGSCVPDLVQELCGLR